MAIERSMDREGQTLKSTKYPVQGTMQVIPDVVQTEMKLCMLIVEVLTRFTIGLAWQEVELGPHVSRLGLTATNLVVKSPASCYGIHGINEYEYSKLSGAAITYISGGINLGHPVLGPTHELGFVPNRIMSNPKYGYKQGGIPKTPTLPRSEGLHGPSRRNTLHTRQIIEPYFPGCLTAKCLAGICWILKDSEDDKLDPEGSASTKYAESGRDQVRVGFQPKAARKEVSV
ncbi:uncharacterized protein BCR38DRAFT_477422 [Pseudomassariella vexata]|uniref:Uncharacterized protein n=1 Tax=Pseudomassariella vexata TaxID=1141098 RepID=A0A1Y2DK17_9PEZI|nr:uncharacterized protein BCR38DRAFT_477422 [Pseudomassariella vexata]ORY59125.1 hypothetical protein BCR38DRAFT_477422 [Pseudomassariella vexata]